MSTPEAVLRIPLAKDADGNVNVQHLIPGRDFICDQEFNIGRTIDPRDSAGDVQSLIGSVGSGSLLEDVHQNITLRPALEEEKTRWLEIHSQDEYLAAVAEAERVNFVPAWIAADGFGRCEAHMAAYPGFDKKLACGFAESIENQNQAIIYGVTKNSSVRPSHFLDVYRGMKAAQGEKYKQNQIAALFRCSAAKVSVTLKICGKLTEADIRKIVKDGSSFQSVEKMIKKRHPNLIKAGATTETTTSTGTKLKTLSGGKRNLYVSSFDRAMTDMAEDSVNHHVLMAAQFTMRYVSGEFEEKSFLEAAQSCSLLEDMDFNFEHDPTAEAPATPPAAPTAPATPVVKKKAASKKAASKKAATGGTKKKASKKKATKKKAAKKKVVS